MITIGHILDFLDSQKIRYAFLGDDTTIIEGFSALDDYRVGTMTWIKGQDGLKKIDSEKAGAIQLAFVQKGLELQINNQIVTESSKLAFFETIEHFFSVKGERPAIGAGTYLSPEVKIGKGVKIGCGCVLDGEITIEEHTEIFHNVTILNKVTIGRDCVVQSGVTIGHDGYSYAENEKHHKKMIKHQGSVLIEDDVFIGPNCVIDRGTMSDTIIGKGTKIDGASFIAHNVQIGENSAIIAGAVILGSVIAKENAYISTSVVKNQIQIGENALIGIGSNVIKDVEANVTVIGNPAKAMSKK